MSVGIVINCHPYLYGETKYDFYAGDGYREYLTDKEKHKLEHADGTISQEAIEVFRKERNNFNLDYMGREGTFAGKGGQENLVLFDKNGEEYYAHDKHDGVAFRSIVYSLVIAFPKDISIKNKFDLSKAKTIANKTFLRIIQANKKWGFDANYFNYDAALHTNTDNTHIHMRLYQPSNIPKEKRMTRIKLSLWGFNDAKYELAKNIEGLKPDKTIYVKKKQLEHMFSNFSKKSLKSMSDDRLRNDANKELTQSFNRLCRTQASIYKLFKAQPSSFWYKDKQTGQIKQKQGLTIAYDNLSAPIYSLEDLNKVKEGKKRLENCKKVIQSEQYAYKNEINKYIFSVVEFDEALNNQNKEFKEFCEIYKQERIQKLAGNENKPNALDSMHNVVKDKMQHQIFDDLQKNMGNEVIKCVTSANVGNKGKSKSSPTKIKLIRKACAGNVQKEFHNHFRNNMLKNHQSPILAILKPLDNTYLDIQIRKERHRKTLENLARKKKITVEELEKQLKEKYQ